MSFSLSKVIKQKFSIQFSIMRIKVNESDKKKKRKYIVMFWQALYKTYIRPRLEFAVSSLVTLSRGARKGTTASHQAQHLWPYDKSLRVLGWTRLKTCRERGDLIFAFQNLHDNIEVDLD